MNSKGLEILRKKFIKENDKIRDYIKKCEQGNKAGQIDISKNAITYNNEMIGLIEETDKEIGSVNNE